MISHVLILQFKNFLYVLNRTKFKITIENFRIPVYFIYFGEMAYVWIETNIYARFYYIFQYEFKTIINNNV